MVTQPPSYLCLDTSLAHHLMGKETSAFQNQDQEAQPDKNGLKTVIIFTCGTQVLKQQVSTTLLTFS